MTKFIVSLLILVLYWVYVDEQDDVQRGREFMGRSTISNMAFLPCFYRNNFPNIYLHFLHIQYPPNFSSHRRHYVKINSHYNRHIVYFTSKLLDAPKHQSLPRIHLFDLFSNIWKLYFSSLEDSRRVSRWPEFSISQATSFHIGRICEKLNKKMIIVPWRIEWNDHEQFIFYFNFESSSRENNK